MDKLHILFKTKGGHKEGMGDVTSSLSLAEIFMEYGHYVNFIINRNSNVQELLLSNNCSFTQAETLSEIKGTLQNKCFDIVILNQLNTPIDESMLYRQCAKTLVTIEDIGDSANLADIRFNILYPIEKSISDFSYIPLGKVYQEKHTLDRVTAKNVKTILVTQGGSDTHGFTPRILSILDSISYEINIKVVIGPNFSHNSELEETLRKATRGFDLIKCEKDLSEIMDRSDLAISAGGNTLFELACLGVPTIIICGEPFENITATRLSQEGFGINLGFSKSLSGERLLDNLHSLIEDNFLRKKMTSIGKHLVNGKGSLLMYKNIIAYHLKA